MLRAVSSGISTSPIIAWLLSATIAASHFNCAQILQLVKVADKSAKRDEAASSRAKIKDWRAWLCVTPCPGKRMPSRNAFQWVRGPIGWVPNTVGSEQKKDAITTDADWDVEFGAVVGPQHIP